MQKFLILVLIFTLRVMLPGTASENDQELLLETIHGNVSVTDPLVIDLIESPAMQRLKKINQYGSSYYTHPTRIPYTRYDHSIGVYVLLCKAGENVGRYEQIAGLLHDISHTVFSHATDYLFMGHSTEDSYQDSIHEQFLTQYGIKEIAEQHGVSISQILAKDPTFRALERELPDLCADRIEYNLFAGHLDGLLSPQDRASIQKHLHFNGIEWFFDDVFWAKKFSMVPLWETENKWGAPDEILRGRWISDALRQALTIQLISEEDIHFGLHDSVMWETLFTHPDPILQTNKNLILYTRSFFELCEDDYNERIFAKFRGVNPWVQTEQGLVRLSKIDEDFREEFTRISTQMKKGWPILWKKLPFFEIPASFCDAHCS